MKKARVLTALSAAVLVTASYFGYRQVINSSESDLFLANVEALSSMEYDDDACALMDGFENVSTTHGIVTGRTHMTDTTDYERDYSYTFCSADGRGKRLGYNGTVDVTPSAPRVVVCTNEHVYVYF